MDVQLNMREMAEEFLNEPVYCSDEFIHFFNNAQINVYADGVPINLMDFFPMLKQGYAFQGTLQPMLILYSRINNMVDPNDLRIIVPDYLFHESFFGTIPIFGRDLNSDQAIRVRNPAFDPKRFSLHNFMSIIGLNTIKCENITICTEALKDPNVVDELKNEKNRVLYILDTISIKIGRVRSLRRQMISEGRQPIPFHLPHLDVYDLMGTHVYHGDRNEMNFLLSDNRINKLYYAIIKNDVALVNQYLTMIDPRDNKHKAYFLAVEGENEQIINAVKDNIIRRNLNEQEFFTQRIQEQVGKTNIPSSLYTYTRRNF